MADAIAEYLLACAVEGKSLRTVKAHDETLRVVCRIVARANLPVTTDGFAAADVDRFLQTIMDSPVSLGTRHRRFRETRAFFSWCTRMGFVTKHPFTGIPNVRVEQKVIQPFAEDEIQRLLAACDRATAFGCRNRDDHPALTRHGRAGAGAAPCGGPRHRHWELRRIHIRQGKGRKQRVVPFGQGPETAIRDYLMRFPGRRRAASSLRPAESGDRWRRSSTPLALFTSSYRRESHAESAPCLDERYWPPVRPRRTRAATGRRRAHTISSSCFHVMAQTRRAGGLWARQLRRIWNPGWDFGPQTGDQKPMCAALRGPGGYAVPEGSSAMVEAPSAVYRLADEYVQRVAALDPLAATSMGVPGHEMEMTDFSPAGIDARLHLDSETRTALRDAPLEDARDRIARDVMFERLELEAELYDAGEHVRDLNILRSPTQRIRSCFDLMPRATTDDWRNIASRMGKVPQGLASVRQTLDAGLAQSLGAAARQAAALAHQCKVWSGQQKEGQASFFHGLVDTYAATPIHDDGLAQELRTAAARACSAYAEHARYLTEQYLPRATPLDPVGRERYQLRSRGFNGIELDLEETYAWGWEEIWRIQDEMAQTAERIKPGATVAEAIEVLEADLERAIEGEEPFRNWMQALQDQTIASFDGVHFDIPQPVKKIEAMIAPLGGALAMYYTAPSEDFSRPGRTWYPTGGRTRFPLWREVSVAHHEGVPGHHLQIAQTRHRGDTLSRYQRLLAGTSGYVEGWALYAERLMAELGYLEAPRRLHGSALQPSPARRARRHRYRHAPPARDSLTGGLPQRRGVDAGAGAALLDSTLLLPGGYARQRDRPLPGLSRASHQLQGGGALLACRPRAGAGQGWRNLRPQGLAYPGAQSGPDGTRSDAAGAGTAPTA